MPGKKKRIGKALRLLLRAVLVVLASFYIVLIGFTVFTQREQANLHTLSDDALPEEEMLPASPTPVPSPSPTPQPSPEPTEEPRFEETDGFIAVDVSSIYDNPLLSGQPIRHVAIRARVHITGREADAYAIEVTEKSVPEYGTKGYVSVQDVVTNLSDIGNSRQKNAASADTSYAGETNDLGFGADPILPDGEAG